MSAPTHRILFLAIPESIHDKKWMEPIAQDSDFVCFLLGVDHTEPTLSPEYQQWLKTQNIQVLGTTAPISIRRMGRSLKKLWWVAKLIKQHNITGMHIFFAEPHALWALVRLFVSVRVTLTTRGTDVLKTLPRTFASKRLIDQIVGHCYRLAFKNIDKVAVTSSRQKKSVLAIRKNLPVSTIRTGVNLSLVQKALTSPRPQIRTPYLFFPRLMTPLYNHEFAIAAATSLPKEIKEKYIWVFVDRDSTDQAYVKKIEGLLEKSGLAYSFLNRQPQEKVYQLYAHAHAVIMTPKSDGSPVSGMEAMAFGKPLVLGPLPYDEDLFNADTTYQLSKWNPTDFCRQLTTALQDTRKVEKAKQTVHSLGSWEKEMHKFKEWLIQDKPKVASE